MLQTDQWPPGRILAELADKSIATRVCEVFWDPGGNPSIYGEDSPDLRPLALRGIAQLLHFRVQTIETLSLAQRVQYLLQYKSDPSLEFILRRALRSYH